MFSEIEVLEISRPNFVRFLFLWFGEESGLKEEN